MSAKEKDFDITAEEIDKIQHALKDEKFRELFFDYCKEISDPENRAKYELEIQQLEKERGFDVTFLKPEAGHVIKAIDQTKNKKVFVNVCTNSNVGNAKVSNEKRHDGQQAINGQNWTVPHILNPPRDDVDKAGNSCQVCDVMFHPDVYAKAEKQKEVMNLLNDIAMDASQKKFGYNFDRNNIKYPKLKYKGKVEKTILRNKDLDNPDKKMDDHLSKFVKFPEAPAPSVIENGNKEETDNEAGIDSKATVRNLDKTTPRYKILQRGHFDMQNFTLSRHTVISTRPAELSVEVDLPTMKSAAGIDLEVFEKRLVLASEKPNYHLDISLPYPVDEDHGKAQFDKNRKVLVITLPIIQQSQIDSAELNGDKKIMEIGENGLEKLREGDLVDAKSDAERRREQAAQERGERKEAGGDSRYSTSEDGHAHFSNQYNGERQGNLLADGMINAQGSECVLPLGEDQTNGDDDISGQRSRDGFGENRIKEIENVVDSGHIGLMQGEGSSVCSAETATKRDERKLDCNCVIPNCSACMGISTTANAKRYSTEDTDQVAGEFLSKTGERDCENTARSLENAKRMDPASEEVNNGASLSSSICQGDESAISKQTAKPYRDRDETLMETSLQEKPLYTTGNIHKSVVKPGEEALVDEHFVNADKTERSLDVKILHEDNQDISTGLEDTDFEFGEVADIAGMTKLPPYDYDQDEDTVSLNINLPSVKIENVSLGFSSRKAYFSTLVDNIETSEPIRWCILIKFPEYCCLDQDLCSIDVEVERVILTLHKSEGSTGLWSKLYVGTSEKNLEEMFFLTDHGMSELLGRMHQQNDPWAKNAVPCSSSQIDSKAECEVASSEILETKLEQLLLYQERRNVVGQDLDEEETGGETDVCKLSRENSTVDSQSGNDCNMISRLKASSRKHSQNSQESTSSSSDMTVEVCLEELHDDVIYDNETSREAMKLSRQPIERSRSDETEISSNPNLRSILKRSKSESTDTALGSDCSDESDHVMQPNHSANRIRSKSLNVDTCSVERAKPGRIRYKSVSFDPEPKVCEFVEYSKKQLKKMRKQERKLNEIAVKKMEAASKKTPGKHKGRKSGKNMNFFNGFRKDANKINLISTDTENAGEKSNGAAADVNKIVNSELVNETGNCTTKPNRKTKKKKKQDERTSHEECRTNSPSEQLTNTLIFELDD